MSAAQGGAGASAGGMTGGSGAAMGGGSSMSASSAGPTSLFGLKPAAGAPQVITLDQALQMTAERNYDLRIAAEQIVQTELLIKKVWVAFKPRLSASGNYIYTTPVTEISFMDDDAAAQQRMQLESQALMLRTLGGLTASSDPAAAEELFRSASQLEDAASQIEAMDPIAIQPAHLFSGMLELQVPIFNPTTIPLLQTTYDAVDQAKLSIDRARQSALYGVAAIYFAATTLKKVIAISENNLESTRSHLNATEARVAAGALPAIALKRAQYDLVQAEQTLRSSRSGYALMLGTLGQMMGVDTMFEVENPAEVSPVEAQGDAEHFYERALEARRDLEALKVALRIADRGMTKYWMSYLPSLNLVGRANWTSNTSGFQDDPVNYNIIAAASLPLYDGGQRYAERDETQSKIRAARITLEKTEAEIAGLIRGNIEDIGVREEGLASARLAVELARENSMNADALFEVGAATNLEVIDANAAAFAAEIDLARKEMELRLARLGLLYIVGEYPPLGGDEVKSPFLEGGASKPNPAAAPVRSPAEVTEIEAAPAADQTDALTGEGLVEDAPVVEETMPGMDEIKPVRGGSTP